MKYLLTAALFVSMISPALATSAYRPGTLMGSSTYTAGGPVGFSINDRHALNDYVTSLPSGMRDTSGAQFRVGESLPQTQSLDSLPAEVTRLIAPAPSGYSYVQAGSNVYLISNSDRQIIDRVGTR